MKKITLSLTALLIAAALTGVQAQSKTGTAINKAADEAQDAIIEAADETEKALIKAADVVEKETVKAAKVVKKEAVKAADKVEKTFEGEEKKSKSSTRSSKKD
ncbi:MAG: hypothetical protein RL266_1404 [Bacteroidota bacterium]